MTDYNTNPYHVLTETNPGHGLLIAPDVLSIAIPSIFHKTKINNNQRILMNPQIYRPGKRPGRSSQNI